MKKVLFVLAAVMALAACEDEKKEPVATDVVDAVDAQPTSDVVQAVDTAVDVSASVDVTSVEQ